MNEIVTKFGANLIRVAVETLSELLNQKAWLKLPKIFA